LLDVGEERRQLTDTVPVDPSGRACVELAIQMECGLSMCRIVGRVPELAEDRGPTGLVLSMIEQLTSQTLFAQVKLGCQVAALTSELRRLLEPATVELKLGGVEQGSHPVVRGTNYR
jgi:hypothetical protein